MNYWREFQEAFVYAYGYATSEARLDGIERTGFTAIGWIIGQVDGSGYQSYMIKDSAVITISAEARSLTDAKIEVEKAIADTIKRNVVAGKDISVQALM
jgi:hypothetical protein